MKQLGKNMLIIAFIVTMLLAAMADEKGLMLFILGVTMICVVMYAANRNTRYKGQ